MSTPTFPSTTSKALFTLGVTCSSFIISTITSLSLVSIPVVLLNKSEHSVLAAFRQSLYSAVHVVIPVTLTAVLSHAANAYVHRGTTRATYFAGAAVTTVGFVPFTNFFIGWINAELLMKLVRAKEKDGEVEERTRKLIGKWYVRNFIRGAFPMVGAVVACAAL